MTLADTLLLRIAGGQTGGQGAILKSPTMKLVLRDSAGVGVMGILLTPAALERYTTRLVWSPLQ